MPQPYYKELADALRQAADKLEPLAATDTGKPGYGTTLYLSAGYAHDAQAANTMAAIVDAIGAAFGAKPETEVDGRGQRRQARYAFTVSYGPLDVRSHAYVPAPPTRARKLAELAAENEALKAKLAARGGAE